MKHMLIHKLRMQARQSLELWRTNSLFRNAVYLMFSTAILSVLGFLFWIFVAHLYSPAQIGSASALIATMLLISYISYVGLNSSLVRFLAKSKNPSGDINASIITVGSIAALSAIIVLLFGGSLFTDNLSFFHDSPIGRILFVAMTAANTINTLTDSVFIARRRANYHTIAYAVFGTVRLVLPIMLVAAGATGIFMAFTAAAGVALVLSLLLMLRGCDYHPLTAPNWRFIIESRRYTTHNYIANLLTSLPGQLLPTFIIVNLGATQTGFFSMAWTMANLLYVIPTAITNSLLAESSHDPKEQGRNLAHAIRVMVTFLVPIVVLSILIAPYLLHLFGAEYSQHSTAPFQILALATIFLAANSIGTTIMNLEHRSGSVVIVQLVIVLATFGLAEELLPEGTVGISLAFLGGMASGTVAQLLLLSRRRFQQPLLDENGHSIYTGPPSSMVKQMLDKFGMGSATVGADVGGGDRSGTWVIEHVGQRYVLKMYDTRKRTREILGYELQYVERLGKAGIPVPTFLKTPRGETIAEIRAQHVTWLGSLMRFESGHHVKTYTDKLVRDMATIQAQIHNLGTDVPPTIREAMTNKDGSYRSVLMGYLPKGLSHFDYYKGNILVDHNRVVCVIDFEGVRYDPLLVCLFFTLSDIYASTKSRKLILEYISVYQKTRTLNASEQFILRLALVRRFRNVKFWLGRLA